MGAPITEMRRGMRDPLVSVMTSPQDIAIRFAADAGREISIQGTKFTLPHFQLEAATRRS
jgi:hypothetical protein